MELLEMRTQIHEKVEKADSELLEFLMEVLEGAIEKRPRYSHEDIAEFERRVATFKSGEEKAYTLDEFRKSIRSKTNR